MLISISIINSIHISIVQTFGNKQKKDTHMNKNIANGHLVRKLPTGDEFYTTQKTAI